MAQKVSKETLAKHNTAGDCWISIDGKVYDVTKFHPNHPGEGINQQYIAHHAGKDVSELFEKFHNSNDPFEMLETAMDQPGEPTSDKIIYIGPLE